ncbi:MAG: hypothetical protein HY832_00895 [Candidatus Aenigmarchaeota archaeon]|nr:hypothetical protein [Candidatus Aenigmarchaeota archaeon]
MVIMQDIWERTSRLRDRIKEKRERHLYQEEDLRNDLYRLGQVALEEGALYTAKKVYLELNDRDRVREVAERCLYENWLHDAVDAFLFLDDRNGIFRTIKKADSIGLQDPWFQLQYIGEKTTQRVIQSFKDWTTEQGFNYAVFFELGPTVNMAYHLENQYDVGIGIAKGGLFSSYIFQLSGLPIKIVESHRKGSEATFQWTTGTTPQEIEGKKLLVLDKDVRTGRTTGRVLKELQRYNPSAIDLALVHKPVPSDSSFGTLVENIPDGYRSVYFPNNFYFQSFDKAVAQIERNIQGD